MPIEGSIERVNKIQFKTKRLTETKMVLKFLHLQNRKITQLFEKMTNIGACLA
jgi:hypothetical protein